MSMNRRYIKAVPGLDAVRFFAAMLVMFYHLTVYTWAAKSAHSSKVLAARIVSGDVAFPELFHITWCGFIGVQIFFVISGFIIAYSAAGAGALIFLRGRIVRLFPAAWICATGTIVLLWALHIDVREALWARYVDTITLSPFGPWVDGVYWTLGIEIVFYALMLGLIAANGFRQLIVLCYVIGGASAAYWLIGALAFPSFQLVHLWDRYLQLSLLEHGVYFALGMLVYCVTLGGRSGGHAAFAALLLPAAAVEIHTKALDNNLTFQSAEPDVVPIAIFLLALVAILASLRWRPNEATARRLRMAGLATYPLYLIHDVFGAAVLKFGVDLGLNRFAALGVAVTLCVGASWFVAAALEPMVRRRLGSAFDRVLQVTRMAGRNAVRLVAPAT